MAHADNNGLVLPPKLAPLQAVIIPIYKTDDQLAQITGIASKIRSDLESSGISVKYDDRDTHTPGWKFADYELKGVPVRIAIGPRDIENLTVEIARRDTLTKNTIPVDNVSRHVPLLLEEIQASILEKALSFRNDNTYYPDTWNEFKKILDDKGGFIMAHWDGTTETENRIKEETKATIRCIPFDSPEEEGKCIFTGNSSKRRVLFARAY